MNFKYFVLEYKLILLLIVLILIMCKILFYDKVEYFEKSEPEPIYLSLKEIIDPSFLDDYDELENLVYLSFNNGTVTDTDKQYLASIDYKQCESEQTVEIDNKFKCISPGNEKSFIATMHDKKDISKEVDKSFKFIISDETPVSGRYTIKSTFNKKITTNEITTTFLSHKYDPTVGKTDRNLCFFETAADDNQNLLIIEEVFINPVSKKAKCRIKFLYDENKFIESEPEPSLIEYYVTNKTTNTDRYLNCTFGFSKLFLTTEKTDAIMFDIERAGSEKRVIEETIVVGDETEAETEAEAVIDA
jgi:hypothetical protein